MASQLVNLRRTLTWKNFTKKPFPVPDPGQMVDTAQTSANGVPSGIVLDPAGGGKFRLRDSIVVTIVLNSNECWVADWVFTAKDATYQNNLLKHEQGHYDITALLGRDLYNALVALRANTYDSGPDAKSAMDTEVQKISAIAQPMSDRYDADTKNGTDPTGQGNWNGYISTAFAQSGSTFRSVLAQTNITI
jgi:hypothetical protein